MDLESIMLWGNKSERERQILYIITYLCNLKNKANIHNKPKQKQVIDIENKRVTTSGKKEGEGARED